MREKSEFKKNFNGEDIKPGEVMIPFEYTELDDENCTNRECIKTLTVVLSRRLEAPVPCSLFYPKSVA